jgi:hypothetical protein
MNPHYPAVAMRAKHRCEYCRAPEAVFNFEFEVEHVTPKAPGGTDSETNLALACRACNLMKSDRVVATDPETGQETRLFHPREDRWREHFEIDVGRALIVGLTPIGRVTVMQLKMNRELQVDARRHWLELGLFP